MDPRLAQVVANSMLWADDKSRTIFLKDTAERLAQIKKMIYSILSDSQKEKLTSAAQAACAWNDSMRLADEARQEKAFADAGIVVSHPDLDAFRANMAKVYEAEGKTAEWSHDLIAAIRALK